MTDDLSEDSPREIVMTWPIELRDGKYELSYTRDDEGGLVELTLSPAVEAHLRIDTPYGTYIPRNPERRDDSLVYQAPQSVIEDLIAVQFSPEVDQEGYLTRLWDAMTGGQSRA